MKNVHLIAIGGAIMHNLAIALQRSGYTVSGSDDEIFDPARNNLRKEGLLPEVGWDEKRIHEGIDQVIVGMHAREDNPELIKARELHIPIVSFPEFIAAETKDKLRLVVGGSHGKTTTTAMIMHALKKIGRPFDYLVGSSIAGFDLSVRLSDAPLIVIEGDEYLSSPLDRRPKFWWYKPQLSILTGIAYDHVNVFPTYDLYLDAFKTFIDQHEASDEIIWFKHDEELAKMIPHAGCQQTAYSTPSYHLKNNRCMYEWEGNSYPLSIIGEHNLQDLEAARIACKRLGMDSSEFLKAMEDFEGAGRRMEKWYDQNEQVVYRDFAHSPSKLKATVHAVKGTYRQKPLTAIFELHTFSSLSPDFLPYYEGSMKEADEAFVYMDPHVFEHKKREPIAPEYIKKCFGDVQVILDKSQLEHLATQSFEKGNNLLLMSSGSFSGSSFPFVQ